MVEMAVGLGAVSRPLKGAVINIFTMPYAAHCPSVLTPYTHSLTHSLMNQATHQPAQTLRFTSVNSVQETCVHPTALRIISDLKTSKLKSPHTYRFSLAGRVCSVKS